MRRIAIVGYSGSGKDTVATAFARTFGIKRCPSCSEFILPYVAAEKGVTIVEAWNTRHSSRDIPIWNRIANNLRESNSPCYLVEQAVKCGGSIIVGIKDRDEFLYAKNKSLFTCSFWVERNGVPVEPSTTIKKEDCDFVVLNDGHISRTVKEIARNVLSFEGVK